MYLYLRVPNGIEPGSITPEFADEPSEYISGWDRARDPRFKEIASKLNLLELRDEGSPHLLAHPDGRVEMCVAYWRKANAVHKWFVDNAQNGVDECQYSDPIHIEQLAKLAALAREVLADPSKAKDKLPPQRGFFFGSTEIDQWYLDDLKYTAERLEHVSRYVIQHFAGQPVEFIYHSSW